MILLNSPSKRSPNDRLCFSNNLVNNPCAACTRGSCWSNRERNLCYGPALFGHLSAAAAKIFGKLRQSPPLGRFLLPLRYRRINKLRVFNLPIVGAPPSARLCFCAQGGIPRFSITRHRIIRSSDLAKRSEVEKPAAAFPSPRINPLKPHP
jgi:hypothetical protein